VSLCKTRCHGDGAEEHLMLVTSVRLRVKKYKSKELQGKKLQKNEC
jgi:hypothetical protein